MILNVLFKSGFLITLLLKFSFANDHKNHNHELFYDKMEVIKGDDILKIDLAIEKTGPYEFKVNGYVEHYKDSDDDWTIKADIYKSDTADGEYSFLTKYPSGDKKKGVCTYLKEEYKKHLYETLKDYSDAPHYETCPLEAAKYTINEYPFDASALKNFIQPGYFIVKLLISHLDEADIIQYDIYVHVECVD